MALHSLSPISQPYSKEKLLGEGTFGKVWLSCDGLGGKLVLKEVPLADMTPRQKDLATQEVEILKKLTHPNIIAYRTSYFTEDCTQLTIAMEFAEKGDLQQRIRRQKGVNFFAETKILGWFVQIISALQYIHRQGILHRDLKTQNILVTAEDTLKLADFGIAFIVRAEVNDGCAVSNVGTPYYLSPEICRNQPYDEKVDMYSAGCCLYEMCCLRVPFPGNNVAEVMSKILHGSYKALPGQYSHFLNSLVQQLLDKVPRKRPSSEKILVLRDMLPYVAEWKKRFGPKSTTMNLPTPSKSPLPSRMLSSRPRPDFRVKRMSVASENSPIVSVKTPSLLAVRDAVGRRKSLIPVPIGNSIRHSTEVTPSHSSVPMIRAKRKSDGITQDDPAVKKSKNVVEMNQPSSPRGAERRRQNVLRQKVTDRQARISAADRLTGGAQQFQFGSPISRFTSRADIECEDIQEEMLEDIHQPEVCDLSQTFTRSNDGIGDRTITSSSLTMREIDNGVISVLNTPTKLVPTTTVEGLEYLGRLYNGQLTKEAAKEDFARHFGDKQLNQISQLLRTNSLRELREYVGLVNGHLIPSLMFCFCDHQ